MNLEQALEKIVELNDVIKDRDEQIQSLSEVIEKKSSFLNYLPFTMKVILGTKFS